MCSPIRFTRPGAKALLPCGFMDATLRPEGTSMDTWRRARRGDRAYVRQVIGERRAVQAFLECEAHQPRLHRGRAPRVAPHERPPLRPAAVRAAGGGPVDRGAPRGRPRAQRRRDQPLPPGAAPRLDARGATAWPPGSRWSGCPRPAVALFAHPPRPRGVLATLGRRLHRDGRRPASSPVYAVTDAPGHRPSPPSFAERQPHVEVVVVVAPAARPAPADLVAPCSGPRRSARRPRPGSGQRAPGTAPGRCRARRAAPPRGRSARG